MVHDSNNSQDSVYGKSANTIVEVDNKATLSHYGVKIGTDGLVNWQRDCRIHPRNWSTRRKTFDATVIILFELYT